VIGGLQELHHPRRVETRHSLSAKIADARYSRTASWIMAEALRCLCRATNKVILSAMVQGGHGRAGPNTGAICVDRGGPHLASPTLARGNHHKGRHMRVAVVAYQFRHVRLELGFDDPFQRAAQVEHEIEIRAQRPVKQRSER